MKKTCKTCAIEKPFQDFPRKAARKDGYDSRCKDCIKLADADRYLRNKEKITERNAAWRAANPDKKRAQKARWKAANPDKHREAKRRQKQRKAERDREAKRLWLEANPPLAPKPKEPKLPKKPHGPKLMPAERSRAWRRANLERAREAEREYRQRNRGTVRAKKVRHKVEMFQRLKRLTPEQESQIAAVYQQCQKISQETGIPHEVDHIAPLRGKIVSGLHVPENLRIITASENKKKGAKVDFDLIITSTMASWF